MPPTAPHTCAVHATLSPYQCYALPIPKWHYDTRRTMSAMALSHQTDTTALRKPATMGGSRGGADSGSAGAQAERRQQVGVTSEGWRVEGEG
eukprot:2935262-Rhodomonas_salina.1